MTPSLNLKAFSAVALTRQPFPHLIVPGFVNAKALAGIHADYPRIEHTGSFPVDELTYGPAFASLLEELRGDEVREAFAAKFGIDLTGRPMMITVRGQSGTRDGNIHTDAVTKIVTVLIYMNASWENSGGRLRLLRSPDDIEDVLVEIPPQEGTLVAFQRTDNSFHGHKPFIGPRRVIQVNWVTSEGTRLREVWRHRVSAWLKRGFSFLKSA